MNNTHEFKISREALEARIRSLEEQARFTYDILEMAGALGDFQTSINKLHGPAEILEETSSRIETLVTFLAAAFYLVDEANSDFVPALCKPVEHQKTIAAEIAYLIENGIFALALRENRPMTVYSRDKRFRLVLHGLATSSRTRGMFIGLMSRTERNISGILLSLLSIILKNCANAIESFELYRLFREADRRNKEFAAFLPYTVFEAKASGAISFINDAVYEQFGLTLPPSSLFTLFADVEHPRLKETIARALAPDPPPRLSCRLQAMRADASLFAVELLLGPVFLDKARTAIRGVIQGA